MISHADKRAALELTQEDIDTAARRTAVALSKEPTGLYALHLRERLAEAMACAVFATDLPERGEWEALALEDFGCERFEREEEAA